MEYFKLPRHTQIAGFLCLGLAAFLTWDLSHWWGLRDDYSFGYLVPLFVAYVLYDRWPRIISLAGGKASLPTPREDKKDKPAPKQPATPAEAAEKESIVPQKIPGAVQPLVHLIFWAAALTGLTFYVFGALYKASQGASLPASLMMATGFAGMIIGMGYIFFDKGVDGQPILPRRRLVIAFMLLFPALIWILSAPMFSALEKTVSTFLLNKVAFVVFNTFDLLGIPLQREGSVLILPNGRVGVEDACSGIRSLTGCLFAGSFLASVFLDNIFKKALLIAAAMVLAIITNLARSLFLTSWVYIHGDGALADPVVLPLFGDIGNVHDVTGFAVLGVTVVLLLCLLPLFTLKLKYELPDDENGGGGTAAPSPAQ